MRPGQQNNKRSRGRNSGRKHTNPLARNFESNGPDVKIRGNAAHIAEKYVQLARDAQASGDNVTSENYLQHAEHYFRILSAAQAQTNVQPRIDQNQDLGGDEDEDYGDENEGANREQESQPASEPRQERPAERRPAPAEASDESDKPAEVNASGEDRPKRPRRPRRKPRSEGENADNLAGSPQPELPAFLTGGSQSAAE
jgi:Domain of unknown function (DUF4167)